VQARRGSFDLTNAAGVEIDGWMVIGEVVGVHIDRAFLKDGIFDTAAARPIARCGYRGDYVEVNTRLRDDPPRVIASGRTYPRASQPGRRR
jgi:flavin reductase (DIM6/NTAB) family NADH-FMN oxidoreductase RutF